MRRGSWPLVGAIAGLAVALAVTLLQDARYRADASIVLVRQGQPPGADPTLAAAAETAAELFDSRAVASSAIENLGLEESPDELVERIEAAAEPGSSLVRIEVDGPRREEARRAAQEVAEVSTVLFNDRFGPQTTASVWEAAGVEELSRDWSRNVPLGALAGALAGWALLLLVRRPPRKGRGTVPGTVPPPDAAVPAPVQAVSGTVPPPAEPATGPFAMPGFGEWTIGDVERLLAEQGSAFPERREELEVYVDTLRSVADADGRLRGDLDLVIEDVFAELIARSGSARRD